MRVDKIAQPTLDVLHELEETTKQNIIKQIRLELDKLGETLTRAEVEKILNDAHKNKQ